MSRDDEPKITSDRQKINVGDLVVPTNNEDFLFLNPDAISSVYTGYTPPDEIAWHSPAIVVDISEIIPQMAYTKVVVLMGDTLAWSYSDWMSLATSA